MTKKIFDMVILFFIINLIVRCVVVLVYFMRCFLFSFFIMLLITRTAGNGKTTKYRNGTIFTSNSLLKQFELWFDSRNYWNHQTFQNWAKKNDTFISHHIIFMHVCVISVFLTIYKIQLILKSFFKLPQSLFFLSLYNDTKL